MKYPNARMLLPSPQNPREVEVVHAPRFCTQCKQVELFKFRHRLKRGFRLLFVLTRVVFVRWGRWFITLRRLAVSDSCIFLCCCSIMRRQLRRAGIMRTRRPLHCCFNQSRIFLMRGCERWRRLTFVRRAVLMHTSLSDEQVPRTLRQAASDDGRREWRG